jgi:hypothetical protein
MDVLPLLKALILADHVYIDRTTGKKVIAGTFNHLFGREFPTVSRGRKHFFASLTDVHGPVRLSARMVSLEENETLLSVGPFEVEGEDPLDTVELVVELPPLPMPREGVYVFEILSGENVLGGIRLFISRGEVQD